MPNSKDKKVNDSAVLNEVNFMGSYVNVFSVSNYWEDDSFVFYLKTNSIISYPFLFHIFSNNSFLFHSYGIFNGSVVKRFW